MQNRPIKDILDSAIEASIDGGILYSEMVRQVKIRFIVLVLSRTFGNQTHAAKMLGMHRNTLSRTIIEFKINVLEIREATRAQRKQSRSVSLINTFEKQLG